MLITSSQLKADPPRCCAFCSHPFNLVEGRAQLWRSPSGQCFCSEFCADDAEEAAFQNRRAPQ